MTSEELKLLPGGNLVEKGLKDLGEGIDSEEALLVSLAAPRLRGLGIDLPRLASVQRPYEHALFTRIEERAPSGAHAAYNALIGRIVSFAQALAATS